MAKKLYGSKWSSRYEVKSKPRKGRGSYSSGGGWWESDAYASSTNDDYSDSWLSRWESKAGCYSDGRANDFYIDGQTRAPKRRKAGESAAEIIYACKADMDRGSEMWPDLDARCNRAAGSVYAYDAAIKDWAREKATKTLNLKGEKADDYAIGIAARAAIDALTMPEWLEMANFYMPDAPNFGVGQTRDMIIDNHKSQTAEGFERDGRYKDTPVAPQHALARMNELEEAQKKGVRINNTSFRPRMLDAGNQFNADDLAAAMADARREVVVSDWGGADLSSDAAMWACGAPVSPFGEREARLQSTVDCLILVDGSGSTQGQVAENLSRMAFAFATSLRAAGHGAAVVPWGSGLLPLSARLNAMLWNDPLPESIPCWEQSGTDLADAAAISIKAFAMRSGKSKRIALVLTDGACEGRSSSGRPYDFGAEIVALWSFQCQPPTDWLGHKLLTHDSADAMRDLRDSELAKALAATT